VTVLRTKNIFCVTEGTNADGVDYETTGGAELVPGTLERDTEGRVERHVDRKHLHAMLDEFIDAAFRGEARLMLSANRPEEDWT
jgi:hypothetical protein